MIRLPFSSDPDWKPKRFAARSAGAAEERALSEEERVARIEARLAALELKLTSHAEELTTKISERVLRIQSRLESALRPFQSEWEAIDKGEDEDLETFKTVIAFRNEPTASQPTASQPTASHHLHAHNACEALYELNQTLRQTKEHMEALASSVDRMKRAVAAR